jgi:RNA polymerase-interacting CarD/CdnL/TRCF family regulator
MQQFDVGEMVVHPVYGVCHIVAIEERQFSQEAATLYYQIDLGKRQLWIPVAAQSSSGLRLLINGAELATYRTVMQSQPVPLPKNQYQRQRDLLNRSKEGSFLAVCEIVRDLTAWRSYNGINATESNILYKAHERLYREWALAAGISTAKAIQEIEALLAVSKPNLPKPAARR